MVTLHGPFTEIAHAIAVDGFILPHVKARKHQGGPDDGLIELVLDNRFGLTCTEEELEKWAWFLANSMAVAAGYTCIGENCNPVNPFTVQIAQIA